MNHFQLKSPNNTVAISVHYFKELCIHLTKVLTRKGSIGY